MRFPSILKKTIQYNYSTTRDFACHVLLAQNYLARAGPRHTLGCYGSRKIKPSVPRVTFPVQA